MTDQWLLDPCRYRSSPVAVAFIFDNYFITDLIFVVLYCCRFEVCCLRMKSDLTYFDQFSCFIKKPQHFNHYLTYSSGCYKWLAPKCSGRAASLGPPDMCQAGRKEDARGIGATGMNYSIGLINRSATRPVVARDAGSLGLCLRIVYSYLPLV